VRRYLKLGRLNLKKKKSAAQYAINTIALTVAFFVKIMNRFSGRPVR
jgi:hypothetical protein